LLLKRTKFPTKAIEYFPSHYKPVAAVISRSYLQEFRGFFLLKHCEVSIMNTLTNRCCGP